MSEQSKLDQFFSSSSIGKRSRPINDRDDFDEFFQTKRRCVEIAKSQTQKRTLNDSLEELFTDQTRKKSRPPTKKEKQDDFDIHDKTTTISSPAKEYIHVKPVLTIAGRWLSKETESSPSTVQSIPDDQRNLMNVQYVPLVAEQRIKIKPKIPLNGKSFHKQLILSDASIVRKENLHSCYNGLLERFASSTRKKVELDDDDDERPVDFFRFPSSKKKS